MSQKGTAAELGTERIGKLLMQYAIPAIIAMTASSLYKYFYRTRSGTSGHIGTGHHLSADELGRCFRFAGGSRCLYPHLR